MFLLLRCDSTVGASVDLPLRGKDDCPERAMLVYLACSEPGSRRWWTQVHEDV
jgi:hypothetical protein